MQQYHKKYMVFKTTFNFNGIKIERHWYILLSSTLYAFSFTLFYFIFYLSLNFILRILLIEIPRNKITLSKCNGFLKFSLNISISIKLQLKHIDAI